MYVPTIFGWNREDVLFLFNVLCYIVCCSLRQEMSIWIRGDSEQESFTVTNHRNTTLTAHCQLPRSSQVFPQLWMANCETKAVNLWQHTVKKCQDLSIAAPPASMTPWKDQSCWEIHRNRNLWAIKSTHENALPGTILLRYYTLLKQPQESKLRCWKSRFPGMDAAQMSMALWRYMVIPAE